eukprot:14349917-Alexandrium_andersonii.AAC.1
MSASLVGSEMCIRDSSSREPEKCFHWTAPLAPDRPTLAPLTIRMPHAAVSYTHLTLPTICSV